MASNDPLIYLEGFYNLDKDILDNLDKYIGIPFKNETKNARYNKLNGMIFGGLAKKPYMYFFRDKDSEELISWSDNQKIKTGDVFARQDYIKRVVLKIKPVNIYYGSLALLKDFYLRFEGTTMLLEESLRGNYDYIKN